MPKAAADVLAFGEPVAARADPPFCTAVRLA